MHHTLPGPEEPAIHCRRAPGVGGAAPRRRQGRLGLGHDRHRRQQHPHRRDARQPAARAVLARGPGAVPGGRGRGPARLRRAPRVHGRERQLPAVRARVARGVDGRARRAAGLRLDARPARPPPRPVRRGRADLRRPGRGGQRRLPHQRGRARAHGPARRLCRRGARPRPRAPAGHRQRRRAVPARLPPGAARARRRHPGARAAARRHALGLPRRRPAALAPGLVPRHAPRHHARAAAAAGRRRGATRF